jgi:YD repeat-containing protein
LNRLYVQVSFNHAGQADDRAKVYTTSYLYNAAGNITQITYPSGRIVIYARDSLGQVSGVTTKQTAAAPTAVDVATGVIWKPMSNLVAGLTHGNGLTTSAGYDLDYRLTSLQVKNGAAFVSNLGYSYGDGMNLTAINDNVMERFYALILSQVNILEIKVLILTCKMSRDLQTRTFIFH